MGADSLSGRVARPESISEDCEDDLGPGLERECERGCVPGPSVEHLLGRMADALSPELVPDSSLAAARAVARRLPGAMTTRLGFEARLQEAIDRADLLLCVTPWFGEREALLARTARQDGLACSAADAWQRMGALAREWARPASRLHRSVSNVWLEFDLDRMPVGLPAPCVFFGLEDPGVQDPAHPGRRQQLAMDRRAASAGLEALGGGVLSPRLTARVDRCFRALPGDAKVFQVGVMLARHAQAVRLCVRRLPEHGFADYLRDVGWSGDLNRIGSCLEELLHHADHVCLDVDVTEDGVLPGLGIECSIVPAPGEQAGPRWEGLLGFAVRLGLCSAKKAAALLEWPGLEAAAADGSAHEVLIRAVSHVKFACLSGRLVEAKGYFGGWRRVTAAGLLRGTA